MDALILTVKVPVRLSAGRLSSTAVAIGDIVYIVREMTTAVMTSLQQQKPGTGEWQTDGRTDEHRLIEGAISSRWSLAIARPAAPDDDDDDDDENATNPVIGDATSLTHSSWIVNRRRRLGDDEAE